MATQAYHAWVKAGSPWRRARPIQELRDAALAAGIPVLGTIGNAGHLTADWPEDHTPFTYTAWPVPLKGYIVTAIDLADVDGLGDRILTAARAGKLPWLKYVNFGGKNYSIFDNFERARDNPDYHVHLSIRSDWVDETIEKHMPFMWKPAGVKEEAMLPYTQWDRKDRDALAADVAKRANPSNGIALGTMIRRTHERCARIPTMDAKIDAILVALEQLAPGVAAAVRESVARVTAGEVAAELELRVKDA